MNRQPLPNFRLLWAVIILIIILTAPHSAQTSTARPLLTEVSGAIETDTTWTQANSPYIMTGDITVNEGIHLRIEPGVIIKGNQGTDIQLRADAQLTAIGTDAEPIIFTGYRDDEHGGDTNGDGQTSSPVAGEWSGIRCHNNPTRPHGKIDIQYALLRYGTILIDTCGDLNIQNSTLEQTFGNAIMISVQENVSPTIVIANNVIRDFGGRAISIQDNAAILNLKLTISDNTIVANDQPGIYLSDLQQGTIRNNTITIDGNNGIYVNESGDDVVLQENIITQGSDSALKYVGIYVNASTPQLIANQVSNFELPVQVNDGYPQRVPAYTNNVFENNRYSGIGVSGVITNGTWTESAGYAHIIVENANLADDATLTIPAGMVVKFLSHNESFYTLSSRLSLGSGAKLMALGTEDNPIIMTSTRDDEYGGDTNNNGTSSLPNRGDWNGILGSAGSTIQLAHTLVRYGSEISAEGNLDIQNSTVFNMSGDALTVSAQEPASDILIADTTIQYDLSDPAAQRAIDVRQQPSSLTIENNQIIGYKGIYLSDLTTAQIANNSIDLMERDAEGVYGENLGNGVIFSGNTLTRDSSESYLGEGFEFVDSAPQLNNNNVSGYQMAVGINGGYPQLVPTYTENQFENNQYSAIGVWGTIKEGTWTNFGGYDHFIPSLATEVEVGATLTIPADTVIKLTPNSALKFGAGANLVAVGTQDAPIVFTTVQDDVYGGDTNNDGDGSTPSVCSWNSITNPNGGSMLQLQHVIVRYSCQGVFAIGDVSILDSIFQHNRYAIYLQPPTDSVSNFIVRRNVLHDNNYGFYIRWLQDSNFTIQENSIANNNIAVENKDSTGTVDVTENWWGEVSGPLPDESNPGATNSVRGNVNYDSWLTAAPDFVPAVTATPVPTGEPTATPANPLLPTNTLIPANTPTDTPIPSPAPTQPDSATPIPTSIATATPAPTTPIPTSIATATPLSPTSTPISTQAAGQESTTPMPDAFEENDNCVQAKNIDIGDVLQEHTFHVAGDVDWMKFEGEKDRTYRIEVQTQAGSPADVNLEIYPNCENDVLQSWEETFTPGVRIDQIAPTDGPIFLRLENYDPSVAGNGVLYSLLVRDISPDTDSQGALIIMAGRLKVSDRLQPNIHNVIDNVYRLFKDNGYSDDDIYYLATDDTLAGYDAPATTENLKQALLSWAVDKVDADRPLTLYMMDHGDIDNLYIDEPEGERLSPDELDSWLGELEGKVEGLKSNIIIEACNSGSFIEGTQRIGGMNRLVISSTNVQNVAYASSEGAQFSDRFLMSLREGYGIQNSFWDARNSIRRHPNYLFQQPWIDIDGDGVPDTDANGNNASQHNPGVDRLPADTWAPYIVSVIGPTEIDEHRGTIKAEVRDNKEVKRVWASVYAPSYDSPRNSRELIPEDVPTFELARESGDLFSGDYADFSEQGMYNITIYAEDNDGLKARLSVLEVDTRPGVQAEDVQEIIHDYYLPFIVR